MIAVAYGSLNLQDPSATGVHTTDSDVWSPPQKQVQSETLAERDGAVIVRTSYPPKVFTVDGYIQAADIAALDAAIDTFKAGLDQEEQNFDIDYAGSTRRYVATARNVVLSRPKGLNVATFSVEMVCEQPAGMDTADTTLVPAASISGGSVITPITVDGTYLMEPIITFTLASGTGLTNKTVTISNDATGHGIAIQRTWANGDVLEIDSLNKTVYVNDAVVPFIGQFPKWDAGSGGISYVDDFTTRSATLTVTYRKRYL